ncbi:hypothetical protein [Emcibacter nanhaiensis]|uniref:ATP-binding protein n=1 Tax=Emcibacter nanhaiensis TaxID=1505037 RepID=A0A501PUW8_9PROT|nr:hypothetical protein [Emcibacter nanhaiensis]TPD64005.1 hypothetical protein FIV46_00065 [Emcibacter nanhaiensis]
MKKKKIAWHLWMEKRSARLNKRRIKSKEKLRTKRITGGYSSEPSKRVEGKTCYFKLPHSMDLNQHYRPTMEFLNEFMDEYLDHNRKIHLDFSNLCEISPAAALVLVSELDRWSILRNFRPKVARMKHWDSRIRNRLSQMGFFKILDVVNPPKSRDNVDDDNIIYIPFWSNKFVVGTLIKEMREALEELTGPLPDLGLYTALIEAMANSVQHAYPQELIDSRRHLYRRWWMSGSYDRSISKLTVTFFDQGVGIPNTIENKYPIETILSFLDKVGIHDNDASRIRAAMELGRSQTGQTHRGKGLPQMRWIIDNNKDKMGKIRVVSNKGEYIYRYDGQEQTQSHARSINGTLIQWTFTLGRNAENDEQYQIDFHQE